MSDTIYIGDAIYAHFDGNGIELKLNDHRNQCAVYLEPEVMENLIEFWQANSQTDQAEKERSTSKILDRNSYRRRRRPGRTRRQYWSTQRRQWQDRSG